MWRQVTARNLFGVGDELYLATSFGLMKPAADGGLSKVPLRQ